jgi:HlyD family secretion protein
MKKWIWSCAILIILIFVAGNTYLYQKYESDVYRVTKVDQFLEPQKGDIRKSFLKDGVVTSSEEHKIIYNPQLGILDEILVKEGDLVEVGSLLLRYKTDELDRLSQQLESKRERALAESEKISKDIIALRAIKMPTAYETEMEEAEAKANKVVINSQIRELELRGDLLDIDIEDYESQIDSIEDEEQSKAVASKMKGIVKSVNLNSHDELLTIITYPYIIQGELSEKDLKHTEVGQKVYISRDEGELVGTISEISQFPVKAPSLHEKTSYFPFSVMVTETVDQLPFGHHIGVEVVKAESLDTLLVPVKSVVERKDKKGIVYVVTNGKLSEHKVDLGIQDKKKVEVTDGITETVLLVLQPKDDMKDGIPFIMPMKNIEVDAAQLKEVRKKEIASVILKAFVAN